MSSHGQNSILPPPASSHSSEPVTGVPRHPTHRDGAGTPDPRRAAVRCRPVNPLQDRRVLLFAAFRRVSALAVEDRLRGQSRPRRGRGSMQIGQSAIVSRHKVACETPSIASVSRGLKSARCTLRELLRPSALAFAAGLPFTGGTRLFISDIAQPTNFGAPCSMSCCRLSSVTRVRRPIETVFRVPL